MPPTPRDLARAAAPALLALCVLGVVGWIAFAVRQPWLFPSLGPTVFLQAVNPADSSARPRSVLLGHAIGVAAGFASLYLCGAQGSPSVFAVEAVPLARAAATALAVGATIFLQALLRAKHPPAAATTMLITLGGMKPGWGTVVAVAAGVGLVAALGAVAAWRAKTTQSIKKQPDFTPGC